MFYMSMMELMKQEDVLCREIQLAINMTEAAEAAVAAGCEGAAKSEVARQAQEKLPVMLAALHRIRAEMGGHLMMMEDMAASTIRRKLESGEGEAEL